MAAPAQQRRRGLTGWAYAAGADSVSGDVLLSRDGVRFFTHLEDPLFDSTAALIPGASITARLWVKNPTASPATMRVSVQNVTPTSGAGAEGVTLTATDADSLVHDAPRPISAMDDCNIVTTVEVMPANATTQILFILAMPSVDKNMTQTEAVSFDLLVNMKDEAAGDFDGHACNETATLATTGSDDTDNAAGGPTTGRGSATNGGVGEKFLHSFDTTHEASLPIVVVGTAVLGLGSYLLLARRQRKRDSLATRHPLRGEDHV